MTSTKLTGYMYLTLAMLGHMLSCVLVGVLLLAWLVFAPVVLGLVWCLPRALQRYGLSQRLLRSARHWRS
jgi:hypothetical protein